MGATFWVPLYIHYMQSGLNVYSRVESGSRNTYMIRNLEHGTANTRLVRRSLAAAIYTDKKLVIWNPYAGANNRACGCQKTTVNLGAFCWHPDLRSGSRSPVKMGTRAPRFPSNEPIYVHIYIYIYINMYVCTYVCMFVSVWLYACVVPRAYICRLSSD